MLLLEAEAEDYGCRILGRKDEPDLTDKREVYVLLDGQQRLTVLKLQSRSHINESIFARQLLFLCLSATLYKQ